MNICIKTIPHSAQRYETVGDWFWQDGALQIRVSNMKNWRYEALVVVHELVEVLICKHNKVTAKQVDKFDVSFKGEGEPGDDNRAPYRQEHCIATGVERILAVCLGVCWSNYEDKINSL